MFERKILSFDYTCAKCNCTELVNFHFGKYSVSKSKTDFCEKKPNKMLPDAAQTQLVGPVNSYIC